MADPNDTELNALAKAASSDISPELLTEVGYSLNALLDALDQVDVPGLDRVEPLPIIRKTDKELTQKKRDIDATGTDDCRRFARQF